MLNYSTLPPTVSNNAFAFDLFREISGKTSGSVLISPINIIMALSLLYNGAVGETQKAISHVLHLQDETRETMNLANQGLKESLESADPKVQLHIANSVWFKATDWINAEFIQRCHDYYAADIGDYEGAPDTMNAWVDRKTEGRIPHIVGLQDIIGTEVDSSLAILLSAIYFKGEWTEPFKLHDTYPEPFYFPNGRHHLIPMMHQSGVYYYLRGNTFQAVRLPYGIGRMHMVFFLPDDSLPQFLSHLTQENWHFWQAGFQQHQGYIGTPRFRCNYSPDLKQCLTALGMEIAFDRDRDDFRDIAKRFYVGAIRHAAFIEVDEKGTEAAAVTSKTLYGGFLPSKPFEVILNRPFFCAIVDESTDSILFMGAMTGT